MTGEANDEAQSKASSKADLSAYPSDQVTAVIDDRRRLAVQLFRFAVLFGVIWLPCYAVWFRLPFVQPGVDIVNKAKLTAINAGSAFPPSTKLRLAVFGDSQIMAGFVPDEFDARMPKFVSFNFGLPGISEFLTPLEDLIASGQVPAIVLLHTAWGVEDDSFLSKIKSDRAIIKDLFPFRAFPRNAFTFLVSSRKHGGPFAFYRHAAEISAGVIDARGYYFIESQSHYPNHQLPEDYSLPTDSPFKVKNRVVQVDCQQFRKLDALANQYHIKFLLIPGQARRKSAALAPPINTDTVEALRNYSHFGQIGPDYVSYDNQMFADPVHLNPPAALIYTNYIADLLEEYLAKNGLGDS